jgi:hypothetical protein
MVVRHGRVTESSQSELTALLRDILHQQTAMLQVQAESVRLQRVVVERLLGVSTQPAGPAGGGSSGPSPAINRAAVSSQPADAPVPAPPPAPAETQPEPASEKARELSPPVESAVDLSFAPAPAEQNAARAARYYQPRALPAATRIAPDELELLRRLQEMRDASELILQFGPHIGSTLAQVAISNPEYIRELMTRAQRPEVRAAAGRLVQALDAAAEHTPKPRSAARRGRPASS